MKKVAFNWTVPLACIMSSVTAKKRFFDPATKLKEFLDLIAQNKSLASSFSL